MTTRTHKFKLPSGVECEVQELKGKHQRILTEQSNETHSSKLDKILADLIVSIGDRGNVDVAFVQKMLASDRKKSLVEARQFTMDFETSFDFTYDYVDANGKKQDYPLHIELDEGFPTKPLMVIDEEKGMIEAAYENYDDIQRAIKITLPSGTEVEFDLLDGKGEELAMKTKKAARSSHTALTMRRPRYYSDGTPIQLNLDNLSYRDIEALRKAIKELEGQVDTEIMFEHPESELKSPNEKDVVLDVLGVIAFFFPSEAI